MRRGDGAGRGGGRRLAGPDDEAAGAQWVLGFHAVLAAVEHQPRLVEVVWLLKPADARRRRVLDAARAKGVRYRLVARRELDAVAGGASHNGVAARLSAVETVEPQALLGTVAPVCLIGLDGVEDGRNVGAVVRVAAGLGIAGVVLGGPHPPPLAGAAAKVAAGTLSLVPVAHVGALGDFAVQAKDAGFWVYGAEAGAEEVSRFELPERLLLCLGAEASGLRAKTRKALDGTVGIPLAPGVESLNLAVAAGVLAWEWRRRFPLPPAQGTGERGPGTGKDVR
jgi:23S rRNA (guanosine2251-2'-O)-methyltransferase